MDIQLFVSDLDGTLLTEHSQVAPETAQAIQRTASRYSLADSNRTFLEYRRALAGAGRNLLRFRAAQWSRTAQRQGRAATRCIAVNCHRAAGH